MLGMVQFMSGEPLGGEISFVMLFTRLGKGRKGWFALSPLSPSFSLSLSCSSPNLPMGQAFWVSEQWGGAKCILG